jgi:hypothetical protein
MAWLAALGSGAGGAAAGAGAAGASAAGSAAAGSAAGAAGSTAASTAGATAAESAGASAAGTAAKEGIKDFAKDTAQNVVSNELTKDDNGQSIKPNFAPQTISSDEQNKLVTAKFDNNGYKKADTTSEIGKMAKGLVNSAEDFISSSEELKTNTENVSDKPQSAASRFNSKMKELGQELGAYAKEEGKNLLSNAIAGSAQGQPVNPIQPGFTGQQISSDEELKTDVDEAGGIVPLFSTIDSYLYKYKPEAQEEYAGTGMMNDDNNLGVMAQDLQNNPLTAPAVKTDEKGNLALDTGRLTSINTAMIAELCKKVMELEGQMYGRK